MRESGATGLPTFSAVIVTLNEADHIRACLEHLAWCEERILVDMHSEDRTRELARDFATTILLHDRIPSMEFARNPGIEAAKGDWIVVVDADEIVPPALATRLQEQATAAGDVVGLWIPRMNYCFGRPMPHVGGFPDYQLRAFRRGAGYYPNRLHSAPQLNGRTIYMPADEEASFLHLRKKSRIGDLVRKWDGYAETEARDRLTQAHAFGGPLSLLWTFLSTFRFRFFRLRGYRDGTAGLVLSLLFAFYRLEVEAKVWETSGCGKEWDHGVGRLRSPSRLLGALAMEAARHLLNRVRRRPGVSRDRGDMGPMPASSEEAPAGPPPGTDAHRR